MYYISPYPMHQLLFSLFRFHLWHTIQKKIFSIYKPELQNQAVYKLELHNQVNWIRSLMYPSSE